MDRRHFLRVTLSAAMIAALDALAVACGDERQTASTHRTTTTGERPEVTTTHGTDTTAAPATTSGRPSTRYGPLAATADANGLLLPAGFRSELLAVSGEVVPGTSYRWHRFPDGGACFAVDGGGWIYVNNSEVPVEGEGGAGALRFDADGRVVDAYRVLDGTTWNCAGGATPWGTWLSCEEIEFGQVWECDPMGREPARARPAMGLFRHEMVVADSTRKVLYLTEDEADGLLYRFRPRTWGDLSAGDLDALAVSAADGAVSWVPVGGLGLPGSPRTRDDAPGATHFPGGEGIALDGDILYLSTKYDNRVSRLDLAASRLTIHREGPLHWGPDNLAVQESTGNLFVCEDGDTMELALITPEGHLDPFVRFVGHGSSEVTGAAFDPTGRHLIVNSQRAPTATPLAGGVDALGSTYMISGPF